MQQAHTMAMDFRQLRHFVAVVDHGNLSTAAKRVYISQPALTRSIKNLEDMLGTALLERSARGTVPTPAGDLFYQHARMILSDWQRASDDIRTFKSGVTGNIALGIGAMFASHIMDEVVRRVGEELPQVSLSVTEGYFEDLMSLLQVGRIDAIFSTFPVAVDTHEVTLEPLTEVTAVIAAGASHPLSRKRSVQLADLAQTRWAVINQRHSQQAHEQLFTTHGLVAPHAALRVNSLGLLKAAVISAGYVAHVPAHVVEAEMRRGQIRRLRTGIGSVVRKAGLIYANRPYQSSAAVRVLDLVRETCTDHVARQAKR